MLSYSPQVTNVACTLQSDPGTLQKTIWFITEDAEQHHEKVCM
jgi:hypothetical protein